jgi:hypothetical protein
MRKRSAARVSRRMGVGAAVAVVMLIAGTGTVLANADGWFGSGNND